MKIPGIFQCRFCRKLCKIFIMVEKSQKLAFAKISTHSSCKTQKALPERYKFAILCYNKLMMRKIQKMFMQNSKITNFSADSIDIISLFASKFTAQHSTAQHSTAQHSGINLFNAPENIFRVILVLNHLKINILKNRPIAQDYFLAMWAFYIFYI